MKISYTKKLVDINPNYKTFYNKCIHKTPFNLEEAMKGRPVCIESSVREEAYPVEIQIITSGYRPDFDEKYPLHFSVVEGFYTTRHGYADYKGNIMDSDLKLYLADEDVEHPTDLVGDMQKFWDNVLK